MDLIRKIYNGEACQLRLILIIATSFALTALTIYNYPAFNPDGLLYLRVAQATLAGGIKAGFALFSWPFYGFLIAIISKITHLSVLYSAYLINGVFSALTILVFIKIVDLLAGSTKLFGLALLVIFCFHSFNSYRGDIIRGHGYWLLLYLSLWSLLLFVKTEKWRYAFCWSLSATVATLFRVEGIAFLSLSPFVAFFMFSSPWRQRFFNFFKLYSLNFLYGLVILVVLLAGYYHLKQVPDLLDIFSSLSAFSHVLSERVLALQQYVLPGLGAVNARAVFVFSLVAIYLLSVASALSLAYLICLIWAWYYHCVPAPSSMRFVVWSYLLINLLVTGVFFWRHIYLSQRYVMPLALILLLYVPFGLSGLFQYFKAHSDQFSWRNALLLIVAFLMLTMLIGSLHRFGPSKSYLYHAGKWMSSNTPVSARVYANDGRLAFFMNRQSSGWDMDKADYFDIHQLTQKPWLGYDYAVFVLAGSQADQVQKMINGQPMMIFTDQRRGHTVLIYKLSN